MVAERGVTVDHSTICRWVQKFPAGDREAASRRTGLNVGPCVLAEAVQFISQRRFDGASGAVPFARPVHV